MDQEYSANPPYEITNRPTYHRGSTIYQAMVAKIHRGANCSNPRSYNSAYHCFETRSARADAGQALRFTPKQYSGKDERETEQIFWSLAERMGFTSEAGMLGVYFKDLESFSAKLSSTTATKSNNQMSQHPNNSQSSRSNLSRQSVSIPSQGNIHYAQPFYPYNLPGGYLNPDSSLNQPYFNPMHQTTSVQPHQNSFQHPTFRAPLNPQYNEPNYPIDQSVDRPTKAEVFVDVKEVTDMIKALEERVFALESQHDQMENIITALTNKLTVTKEKKPRKPKAPKKKSSSEVEDNAEEYVEEEEINTRQKSAGKGKGAVRKSGR